MKEHYKLMSEMTLIKQSLLSIERNCEQLKSSQMKQEQVPVTVTELLPQICQHINVAVRSAMKEVLEQLSKNKPSKESNINDDHLSAEQAASYLKIKLNTIYAKAIKGDLPYSRSGKRKLLFAKRDLEAYVSKRKVKSHDEINQEVETYLIKKK